MKLGGNNPYICLEEFRLKDDQEILEIKFEDFELNDYLQLTGTTKGKGFTGAVKRWGFHGQPASHGHDHVKAVGSIGTRWPQRTLPGKKMAGRMGGEQGTVQCLRVMKVDKETGIVVVHGAVPGPKKGIVKLQDAIKKPWPEVDLSVGVSKMGSTAEMLEPAT